MRPWRNYDIKFNSPRKRVALKRTASELRIIYHRNGPVSRTFEIVSRTFDCFLEHSNFQHGLGMALLEAPARGLGGHRSRDDSYLTGTRYVVTRTLRRS